jgi:hypothetical protein
VASVLETEYVPYHDVRYSLLKALKVLADRLKAEKPKVRIINLSYGVPNSVADLYWSFRKVAYCLYLPQGGQHHPAIGLDHLVVRIGMHADGSLMCCSGVGQTSSKAVAARRAAVGNIFHLLMLVTLPEGEDHITSFLVPPYGDGEKSKGEGEGAMDEGDEDKDDDDEDDDEDEEDDEDDDDRVVASKRPGEDHKSWAHDTSPTLLLRNLCSDRRHYVLVWTKGFHSSESSPLHRRLNRSEQQGRGPQEGTPRGVHVQGASPGVQ